MGSVNDGSMPPTVRQFGESFWDATVGAGVRAIDKAADSAVDAGNWVKWRAAETAVRTITVVGTEPILSKIVEVCAEKLKKPRHKQDGQYMGKDCPKSSKTEPKDGTKPDGCENSGKAFPKVIYANGMNTQPKEACETMHNLANKLCVEVIGVYNGTEGYPADIANSRSSVYGKLDPSGKALSDLSQQMLARGETVNIVNHSEGGLNTIGALGDINARSREQGGNALQNINVVSMGTATNGWPNGPNYVQVTNLSDPIPGIIQTSQRAAAFEQQGIGAAWRFGESQPSRMSRNVIDNPRGIPSPGETWPTHSVDNTYIPELARLQAQNKTPFLGDGRGANGKCC